MTPANTEAMIVQLASAPAGPHTCNAHPHRRRKHDDLGLLEKEATCGTHVAKAEGHENLGWSKACNTQNWPGLSISQKGVQSKHLFSTERVLNDPNWHAKNGQLKAVRQYWVPTFNHPALTTGTSLDGLGWREISHLLVPCLTWARLQNQDFWAKSAARPDVSDVSRLEDCAISLQQGTQSILALGGEIIPQL